MLNYLGVNGGSIGVYWMFLMGFGCYMVFQVWLESISSVLNDLNV